jgi:hypothetical protein
MDIDAMTILHQGLFRTGTPDDGAQTFSFGMFQTAAGSLGRYKSFYLVETGADDCCISHRIRLESWAPEVFVDTDYAIVAPLDVTSAYYPLLDRAGYGARFDPEEYQIEVKFKPNLGPPFPPAQQNQATTMSVSFDQHFGFIFDAQEGIYKRSVEQVFYNIGSDEMPINTWYATAPKDADGFATWTVPVVSNDGAARSTYFNYGDGAFRDANVVTGGGRMQNPDGTWADVTASYNAFSQFGGGPEDPNRPGSKLNTPNGVSLLYFGAPGGDANLLSVEVKSVALTKINPGPIAARIDEDSGLTARFGSGFTRGPNATPIMIPGDPFPYLPRATDQISRFDQNGMTNLFINMRTPDDPNEVHRFILRYGASANTFEGTDAVVNVRARLTEPLTNPGIAQSLTIVAKDLDGNDMAPQEGADEYTYNLDLNQFNTSTFTTVSIPLSAFALSEHVPRTDADFGSGPGGFANAGDESLEEFNLYEFGGLIPANGGLLRLELDYMEIRLPEATLAGDYNQDGNVDAADYVAWRNDPAAFGGDPAGYDTWRGNFGTTTMGSANAASIASVPEPHAWLLTTLAVAICGSLRRQRMQYR